MSDRHHAVFIAANSHQAHLLRNILADSGIASFVANDTLNGVHFAGADWMVRAAGGPGFAPTAPRIVVHEDDYDAAREILLQAEASLLEGGETPELAQLTAAADEESRWPACPHCDRPRLATCPICQTSGTSFAEAFYPESQSEDDDRHLVICPTCDEAFAPRHPARCEWCGHWFADGVEAPERSTNVSPPQWISDFNPRVAVLLTLMACMIAGILAWFNHIAKS